MKHFILIVVLLLGGCHIMSAKTVSKIKMVDGCMIEIENITAEELGGATKDVWIENCKAGIDREQTNPEVDVNVGRQERE